MFSKDESIAFFRTMTLEAVIVVSDPLVHAIGTMGLQKALCMLEPSRRQNLLRLYCLHPIALSPDEKPTSVSLASTKF